MSSPAPTSKGTSTGIELAVSPPITSVAPNATSTPSDVRSRGASGSNTGSTRASGGSEISAASATSGSSPRNTQRQPIACATKPASPGPARPGTTHAVESTANIRACSDAG